MSGIDEFLAPPSRWRRVLARLRVLISARGVGNWRDHFRTIEVDDAEPYAGDLFRKAFGHSPPTQPRHFVTVYIPPPDGIDIRGRVVAYSHHRRYRDIYLGGGMCVDERAYRAFPRWLFKQVKEAGGLATIVARDSIAQLGDAPACFGHVGEPRARQADLRTGFEDTGYPHLMVYWRRPLSDREKARLIELVAAHGPF